MVDSDVKVPTRNCYRRKRVNKCQLAVGMTVGRLKIIAGPFYVRRKNSKLLPQWACECICGKDTLVIHSNLARKSTVSCGCYGGRLGVKGRSSKPFKHERYLLATAKNRAKKRGLPFDLTVSDIVIPDVCPVLGIKLTRNTRGMADTSPSLDRKIGDLGYVKGNVAVISYRANRIKSDATLDEIRKLLVYMEEL